MTATRLTVPKTIVLVGLMGAGKTTIGRRLATVLKLPFIDSDQEIVEAAGCSIADIFEMYGEAIFRDLEQRVLLRLVGREPCVIATGGGAILAEENRRVMRDNGTVVYLRARLESLWERTRHDSSRPLLKTPDPKGTLERLLGERDPLYREAAHVIVDTGSHSASSALGRVVAALRAHGALAGQDG